MPKKDCNHPPIGGCTTCPVPPWLKSVKSKQQNAEVTESTVPVMAVVALKSSTSSILKCTKKPVKPGFYR